MITCPKCGTDNLLTAIFCRGCGERLNLDELRPDNFEPVNTLTPAQLRAKKINQITGIVLAIVLVILLIGLIFPVGTVDGSGELSPEASQNLTTLKTFGNAPAEAEESGKKKKKKKEAEAPKPAGPSEQTLTFSDTEASIIAVKTIGLPKDDNGGKVSWTNFSIRFHSDGTAQLILTAKFFKAFAMHNVMTVKPTVGEKGSVTMEVKGTRIGLIPLPGKLGDQFVTAKFKNIAQGPMSGLKSYISASTMSNGSVTVTVSK